MRMSVLIVTTDLALHLPRREIPTIESEPTYTPRRSARLRSFCTARNHVKPLLPGQETIDEDIPPSASSKPMLSCAMIVQECSPESKYEKRLRLTRTIVITLS